MKIIRSGTEASSDQPSYCFFQLPPERFAFDGVKDEEHGYEGHESTCYECWYKTRGRQLREANEKHHINDEEGHQLEQT